jgi:hypothetical protein
VYLDSLATFVSPEGQFLGNFGLPDTGALLFAMSEHYRLTGDEAWLRKSAPKMIKMCGWIINMRAEAMRGQAKESPYYGLIKGPTYCDHQASAYSYLTDCYLVVGMEYMANVLGAMGMTEDAARFRNESDAYRRDIQKSMNRAVIEHGGMKILPLFPETHELLKAGNYTGRDYYSIVAGMLLETDFLSPSDASARLLTDFLERRGGLEMGMCAFRGEIDHAYTYGYWMNCLQRDEVKRVLLGFYGSLAYGMSRETYSAVEVTNFRTGSNNLTLPHLYSNTQQLRLLRNMLVGEQEGCLLIAPAIPRPWLEHGKQIRVEDAPTLFGTTRFTIDSHVDEKRITVTIDPPTRKPAEKIKVRLRHPRGEPIKEVVTVDGIPIKDFTADTVTLTSANKRLIVEVRY